MWDLTRGEKVGSLVGHENRVSCLGVSNDGISLCTGSWDSVVSIIPIFGFSGLSETPTDAHLTAQGLGLLERLGQHNKLALPPWIPNPSVPQWDLYSDARVLL